MWRTLFLQLLRHFSVKDVVDHALVGFPFSVLIDGVLERKDAQHVIQPRANTAHEEYVPRAIVDPDRLATVIAGDGPPIVRATAGRVELHLAVEERRQLPKLLHCRRDLRVLAKVTCFLAEYLLEHHL